MTVLDEEFITNFHSLEGITIGERQRNLRTLLDQHKELQNADFSTLLPKTLLEESLKVEALIYLQNIKEIFNVLKNGNPLLIQKVLNSAVYLQFLSNMTGKDLLNLFPYFSYNVKFKILHKLALFLDTQKADEFFYALVEGYGVYVASQILTACSSNIILKTVEENRIEITPRNLLIICRKYPDLVEDLFEKLNSHKSKLEIGKKYKIVFRYLLKNDKELFFKLHEKYNTELVLGSRTSKKFIQKYKSDFVENPRKYLNFLKNKKIKKECKEDIKDVVVKLLPKTFNYLIKNNNYNKYLQLIDFHNAQKLKIFMEAFKIKYKSDMLSNSAYVIKEFLEMMKPEERNSWMQTHKRPEKIPEEEWISLMIIEKSIPALKEKISFTSNIKERAKLVKSLAVTCKINRDKEALLEVCKYVINKHRNDNNVVKIEFADALSEALPRFKDLNEEYWRLINEFISISDATEARHWALTEISKRSIQFYLKNNISCDSIIIKFMKNNPGYLNIVSDDVECEKIWLSRVLQYLPQVYKDDNLADGYINYLNVIIVWNKKHPKDTISLFENSNAIEVLKNNLKTKTYIYDEQQILLACLNMDWQRTIKAGLLENFFKQDTYDWNGRFMRWWNRHPLLLKDYLPQILKNPLKSEYFKVIENTHFKYYSHLDIPKKVSELCLEELNGDNDYLKTAAVGLSLNMPTDEFLSLPAFQCTLDVDIHSEEGLKVYKQLQALLPSLAHIVPPTKVFNTILKFAEGDYLNIVQRSLYSVAHNAPENSLPAFFAVLGQRAVSVRKHAIFLGFKVLNKDESYKILSNYITVEKNPSIKKTLFKGIFNYFMRNPDAKSWQLAKEAAVRVDPKDKEAFNILSKCGRIPSRFFIEYTVFAWNTLEKAEKEEVRYDARANILDAVTSENIKGFSEQFCQTILKDFLQSKEISNYQKKIQSFLCKYLIYKNQDKMKAVFDDIQKYVKEYWWNVDHLESHVVISNFIKEFCANLKEDNQEILIKFIEHWDVTLKSYEFFDDFLYMHFTLIWLEAKEKNLPLNDVTNKVLQLWDSLEVQSVNLFVTCFNEFASKLFTLGLEDDEEENKNMFNRHLFEVATPSSILLALNLVPKESYTEYEDLLRGVINQQDSLVQIHLHHFLTFKDGEKDKCNNWF